MLCLRWLERILFINGPTPNVLLVLRVAPRLSHWSWFGPWLSKAVLRSFQRWVQQKHFQNGILTLPLPTTTYCVITILVQANCGEMKGEVNLAVSGNGVRLLVKVYKAESMPITKCLVGSARAKNQRGWFLNSEHFFLPENVNDYYFFLISKYIAYKIF